MRATEHFFIGDAQAVLHALPAEDADDDAELAGAVSRTQRPVKPRGCSGAKELAATGVPEQPELQEETLKDKFEDRDPISPAFSFPVAEADIAGGGSLADSGSDHAGADAAPTDARRSRPATTGEHGSACDQLQCGDRSHGDEVSSAPVRRTRWSEMSSDSDDGMKRSLPDGSASAGCGAEEDDWNASSIEFNLDASPAQHAHTLSADDGLADEFDAEHAAGVEDDTALDQEYDQPGASGGA
jgi:hypothetical protein